MIQLVLYSDRQNAVAGKLHTFAFTVKKLTFDIFGAFYFAFKIRHRQTAFAADNGTFPFGDNRIDKLDQAFANVDNYYSSGNTYLRRCQAYAVCRVHGFRHILRQLVNTFINAFHFGSNFFQAGIGKAKDR